MLLFVCIMMMNLTNNFNNSFTNNVVKQKHNNKLKKQQSEYESAIEATSAAYKKKIEQLKSRLEDSRQKVADERKKWQETLNVLDAELATTKDQVYNEKVKRRNAVQQQIDETKRIESDLRNYTECLEEKNVDLCRELKDAIIAKHAAARSSRRDKHLAKSRLDKWHKEK